MPPSIACCALLLPAYSTLAAQAPVALESARVRVECSADGGALRENYLARNARNQWIPVATHAGRTAGSVSLELPGGAPMAASNAAVRLENKSIVQTFTAASVTVTRTITIAETNWLKVTTRMAPAEALDLHSFTDRFHFTTRPNWSYSPSIGGFNPDAQYKTPLILVQTAASALGIVPDVSTLTRSILKRVNHAIDLDVPAGPMLTAGFTPARMAYHSVYAEDADRFFSAAETLENTYYVFLTASAQPAEAYRNAVRFAWQRFGRTALASAATQQTGTDPRYASLSLWDDWRRIIWDKESLAEWLSLPMPDGTSGGAVRMIRLGGPRPSLYLSAWFNSLRTAYGMALYARRGNKPELMELARQTANATLKAPGTGGAFKCVAIQSPGGAEWAAGDGSGGSTRTGFLGFDMAWTGFWLLKWWEARLPGWEPVLARAEALGEFFLARQLPDGMLPTRFDESGGVQLRLSRDVAAETAPVARFLFELHRHTRKAKYFDAGARALAFLDRAIVPERKWYDFETFWSCSPRLISFDERTRQWPANNLALIHAAGAYLSAYGISGDKSYLQRGEAVLDYLLLYQQVWTNPALEELTGPAMLLGGFTTQNSDAEWSDARQSLAGNVLMDYYRATRKPEYLERGVSALRAQFPISPSENWAHAGYGKKAGVSGFHWGSGSGMAGIEIEEEFLRDASCDLTANAGIGVNGLHVIQCSLSGQRIQLEVDSPFSGSRRPVITFHNIPVQPRFRLYVNGREAGAFSREELERGVAVSLER